MAAKGRRAVDVLANQVRVKLVLTMLAEQTPIAPAEFAVSIDEPCSVVAYHGRVLVQAGLCRQVTPEGVLPVRIALDSQRVPEILQALGLDM